MEEKRGVGRVKWFDETKKHGVISPLGEEEDVIFELEPEDETILVEDQVVEYSEEETDIGTQAKEIVPLD